MDNKKPIRNVKQSEALEIFTDRKKYDKFIFSQDLKQQLIVLKRIVLDLMDIWEQREEEKIFVDIYNRIFEEISYAGETTE